MGIGDGEESEGSEGTESGRVIGEVGVGERFEDGASPRVRFRHGRERERVKKTVVDDEFKLLPKLQPVSLPFVFAFELWPYFKKKKKKIVYYGACEKDFTAHCNVERAISRIFSSNM